MRPRIGLGCMRLSTDEDRDEQRAFDTIAAAVDAGIVLFDTARAYGHGERELSHNERLLADALRRCGAGSTARIVTKGGMSRAGGGWLPDGRAKTILSDCEASVIALDGLNIDLYLLHAPDPRTPWRTSVRALARLVDDGVVRRVGISNVNVGQLDEALELAPISAVQVALSVFDDRALRGGLVERCEQAGITLLAHSPLGGPKRAGGVARREPLTEVARAHDSTAAEVALAWLLDLSPVVVPIPGARRPETARSLAQAATLELDDGERRTLARAFGGVRPAVTRQPRRTDAAEVIVVMGIPGAGKTRLAHDYVARGFVRLNRDERGGSLRDLADALDEELASGPRSIVLDNTYLTRATRSYVLETAHRHGSDARCIWLDTPLPQAQINLVERSLERFGSLPTPEELKKGGPEIVAPTSLMRTLRELEPPSADEGWDAVERVSFVRVPERAAGGVFIAAAALMRPDWMRAVKEADPAAPHLIFDWDPGGSVDSLASAADELRGVVEGQVQTALCPHEGGPPRCWCRPPLPGLPLAFARVHQIEITRSTVIGCRPAHRTLSEALGAQYVDV